MGKEGHYNDMSLRNVFDRNALGSFVKSPSIARNLESDEQDRVWGWRYRHICHSLRDLGAFTVGVPTIMHTVNQFMQDSQVAAEAGTNYGELRIRLLWSYLTVMLASRYSSGNRDFGYYGNEVGFIRNDCDIRTNTYQSPITINMVYDWNNGHSTSVAYRVLLEILNLGGIDPVTGYREWSKCNSDNTLYYTPYPTAGKSFTIHQSTTYKTQPNPNPPILMTNGEIVFDELEQCIDYLKRTLHKTPVAYNLTEQTGLYTGNSSGCTADPGHGYSNDPVATWYHQYRYTWDGAGPHFSTLDIDQYILHPGWLAQYTAWGVCINAKLSKDIGLASPYYAIAQRNTFYGWIKDNQTDYMAAIIANYALYQWSPTTVYNFSSPYTCEYFIDGHYNQYTNLQNPNVGHHPTETAWWQQTSLIDSTHYENQFYLRFSAPAARYTSLTNGWITSQSVDKQVFLNYGEQDPYGDVVSPIPGDGNPYVACYKSFHVKDHFQMNEYQFQSKVALGYKDMYHPNCPFCNRPLLLTSQVSISRVYGQGFTPAELADIPIPITNRNTGSVGRVNIYTSKVGNFNVTPLGISTVTDVFNLHYEVLDTLGPDALPTTKTYTCNWYDIATNSDTYNSYFSSILGLNLNATELRHSPGSTERDMNILKSYTNPRVNLAFSITNTNGGRIKWSMGTPTWTAGVFGYFDKSSDDVAYNNGNPLVSNFNLILTDTTFLTQKGVIFRINYTGGNNTGWGYTDFWVYYLAKP